MRGGGNPRDLDALRLRAENFWLPMIDKLSGITRELWEPVIREICEAESKGEWGRLQPGEPEDDLDEEILDVMHMDGDGETRRYDDIAGREKAAVLLEQMGKAGANSSELEQRWWESVDRDNIDRDLLVEWFEETTCFGQVRHGLILAIPHTPQRVCKEPQACPSTRKPAHTAWTP